MSASSTRRRSGTALLPNARALALRTERDGGLRAPGTTRVTRLGPLPFLVAMVLVALMPWFGASTLLIQLAELVMFFAMLTSGLNLTFGYAGEFAFTQPALYALGAYVGGYMALHGVNNILLTVIAATAAAGVAGLILGIPALRLGGWSTAMVSFLIILTLPDIENLFQAQTGGTSGLAGIPLPQLFGATLTTGEYFVICVALAGIVVLLSRNLIRSRHGRAFLVLRESPVLAQSLGVNVYRMKVELYVLGGMSAGAAGALFAYLYGYVSPSTFGFDTAIALIAASVIGGSRSIYGCFIGAALVEIGPFESTSFQQDSLVVYGLLLVLVGVLLPSGISAVIAAQWQRFANRWLGGAARSSGDEGVAQSTASPEPLAAVVAPSQAPVETASVETASVETASVRRPVVEPDARGSDGQGLHIETVTKDFGGVRALDGVSLVAPPGRVTALIGANGSGKTTLLNVIAGFYPPTSGQVRCDGERIDHRPPHRALSSGIARTFQTPMVPAGLTAAQVVMSARYRMDSIGVLPTMLRFPRYRRITRADEATARVALERVGLGRVAEVDASSLPLGTRRLLEVARALAATPKVLLLDEPASGLSEDDVERLGSVIRDFSAGGGVVVIVEHNFNFVTRIADQIYVLELGRLLAAGTPQSIRSHPEVVRSYLGEELRPSEVAR